MTGDGIFIKLFLSNENFRNNYLCFQTLYELLYDGSAILRYALGTNVDADSIEE